MSYLENNPTVEEKIGENAKVKIVRVAPYLGGVEIEYRKTESNATYTKLLVKELKTGEIAYEKMEYCTPNVLKADRLLIDVDYVAEIILYDKNKEEIARSTPRLLRCGFFPGKVIDYIHPDDLTYMRSGEFIGSPHIVKLNNGSYVASHDIFSHGGMGHETLCKFFVSKNYGESWNYISEVEHCTWGTMFVRDNVLYILGINQIWPGGGGDIVLYYSTDDAISWSEPIILAKKSEGKVFRTAPTPCVEHKGRLWFYASTFNGTDSALGTISVDLSKDTRNPESWILSEEQHYDESWENVVPVWNAGMMEEGNMVVAPDGKLKMFARCNSHRYDTPVTNPENVRAFVFNVDENNPEAKIEFEQAIPFNGALHKFYIQYDKNTGRYVALLNRMTTDQIWQRNVLSLASSKDLYKWQMERDLINLEDINWSEDAWKCGVQYPGYFIEENEIVAVVRTAINGADNFHNANAITFHRFKDINDKYRF